jgi:hypothetical protein
MIGEVDRLIGGRDGAGLLIAFGATLLLVVLCIPIALQLDARIDRDRPLYLDRDAMAGLQLREVQANGEVAPLELGAQESVDIAGTTFRTAPGVTLRVTVDTVDATSFCVSGTNEHGTVTEPLCGDDSGLADAS